MDAPPAYQEKGYPPQQPGYPPQQPGYPPQQPGYPPQQPGYPPPQAGYPPPQAGYQQQQMGYPAQSAVSSNQTSSTVIVTSQPTTIMPVCFGEFPVPMTCPSCRASIVTAVVTEPGTFAYLMFFLMCIFGLWICCCIPFCVDSCKDSIHSCPNCRAQLGVYKRM